MRSAGRVGVALFLILLTCGFIFACGGSGIESSSSGNSAAAPMFQPATDGTAAMELPQVDLERAMSDLAMLQTPIGVDAVLFAELKDTLAGLLTEVGTAQLSASTQRTVSALDPMMLNGAWCLDGNCVSGTNVGIDWRGRHLGDYDLNGEVNVADITPLAVFFGRTVEFDDMGLPVVNGDNEEVAQVDGDGNGEVNAADITQIALNFGSRLMGYRLYPGFSTDGETFEWDASFLPNQDDETSPVTVAWNPSTGAGEVLRYTTGFTYIPEPGADLYVMAVPYNGTAEGPDNSIPVPEGPHAMFKCSMCHQVTDLVFKGKDKSCYICHEAPPEDRQVSWNDTPGVHGECMTCHDEHTFTISPAESICGNCHSTQAAEVAGSGMTACLDCHLQAHMPNPTPTATECGTCHDDKATELAGSAMQDCMNCHSKHVFSTTYTSENCQACHSTPPDVDGGDWANAPGQHSNCQSCHSRHTFAIAEPNSVCASCHQSQIDAGHAGGATDCLTCHVSPHIPEMAVTGTNCLECHPNPPENPDAQWTDAPGLHAECALCHSQPEHGYKPTPPESVCANCHPEPIAAGHETTNPVCLDCHMFPHLPQFQMTGDQCATCHSDYAGNGNHTGSCTDCHPNDHTMGAPWDACWDCHAF